MNKYKNVIMSSSNTQIIGSTVRINGKQLPPAPSSNSSSSSVTVINNKIFINGYEWKDGKWQRTLRALWHLWF